MPRVESTKFSPHAEAMRSKTSMEESRDALADVSGKGTFEERLATYLENLSEYALEWHDGKLQEYAAMKGREWTPKDPDKGFFIEAHLGAWEGSAKIAELLRDCISAYTADLAHNGDSGVQSVAHRLRDSLDREHTDRDPTRKYVGSLRRSLTHLADTFERQGKGVTEIRRFLEDFPYFESKPEPEAM